MRNKQITATIREGVRDQFHPKGYKIRERVILRCFQKPGVNEFRATIVINDLVFKKISDLTKDDLAGDPPDSFPFYHWPRSIYKKCFLSRYSILPVLI